jgi:hypothetical protein
MGWEMKRTLGRWLEGFGLSVAAGGVVVAPTNGFWLGVYCIVIGGVLALCGTYLHENS